MNITIESRDTKIGQFHTITIDGITINDCQRKQGTTKDGRDYDFIAGPQRKYQDKDGKDKWVKLVTFNDATSAAIINAIESGTDDTPDQSVYESDEIPF